MLSRLRHTPFSVQVLLALVLGVALGAVATSMGQQNWLTTTLSTVGSTFVQLLRITVPPLVFTAIVASVANLRQVANAARLATRTLIWFAVTSLIAVCIGIGLGLLTNPGRGVALDTATAKAPSSTGSWTDFLSSLIPGNVLGAEVSTDGGESSLTFNVLQIVVLALVVGIATVKVGDRAEPFLAVVDSVLAIVQKVLWWHTVCHRGSSSPAHGPRSSSGSSRGPRSAPCR